MTPETGPRKNGLAVQSSMTQLRNPQLRLAYIDWMRGLACLLMFQTHCYDAWLSPEAKQTEFFKWSQLGGTFPAPLFLFLAGFSFALVTDKLRERGMAPAQIARTTIRRGAEIYALSLLFRLQEYALGFPWAPRTDLLRVDILNMIGLSMVFMGLVCWAAASLSRPQSIRAASVLAASIAAAAIAMLSPPLWTTWRPAFLPWPLESYINGVHIFPEPQPWLFPVFPWAAFAFAGLTAGFLLLSAWSRAHEARAAVFSGLFGVALFGLGYFLDHQPFQLYAVYDYWHTSPNFFLARLGILLVILLGSYVWCRWGAGQWVFSPLIQLGKTSLLVYWVHIAFVYGRFSILPKGQQTVAGATGGLLAIFLAMLLLSIARTRLKGRGGELLAFLRRRVPST